MAATRLWGSSIFSTDAAGASVGTVSSTPAGAIIVSGAGFQDSDFSGRSIAVTDDKGNTYTVVQDHSHADTLSFTWIAYCLNPTPAVTQITCTATGAGVNDTYWQWAASGWSGLSTGSAQASGTVPSNASDTPATSGSTSSTPVLLFAMLCSGGSGNYVEPSGWTSDWEQQSNSTQSGQAAYFSDSSATGVKSADWTTTPGGGGSFTGCIAAFGIASGGATTTKTLTDTVVLADAALDPTYRVRQMSDAVVVIDDTTLLRRLKRVMDEAATVVDSVVKTLILSGATTYTKVMSDTLALTDAAVQWLRRVRGPIDTVTLSDGDTYRFSIITASDGLDTSDGFVSWRRLKRVAQDSFDLIDGFSKTLAGVGIVYAKVMSDTVTVIDDAGRRWKLRVSQLTDAVGLSDQVIRSLRAVRTLGDDVEFSDGTVKVRRTVKSMDESIVVGDDKVSTLYLDVMSNTSFAFGSSGPPFRFGGM